MDIEFKAVKYIGTDAARFAAVDGSFAGIINPGDIFQVSAYTFDLSLKNDPRYELASFDIRANKKIKNEGKA